MLKDNPHTTPTLAKTLADQGHLQEALEAYRFLLSQTPGHVGYQDALDAVQSRMTEQSKKGDTLPDLFEQWISLALTYVQLQRVKKLRSANAHFSAEDRPMES